MRIKLAILSFIILFSSWFGLALANPPGTYNPLLLTGCTPWVTAYSTTLDADNNNGVVTYAIRTVTTTLSNGGNRIRITINSSNSGSQVASHASVGIANSPPNTLATPIELLKNGVSGYSLSSGQSFVTDEAVLTTTTANSLVIDMDTTTTNWRQKSTTGAGGYYKAGVSDYNQSSVTGYSNFGAAYIVNVSLVEVRTCN